MAPPRARRARRARRTAMGTLKDSPGSSTRATLAQRIRRRQKAPRPWSHASACQVSSHNCALARSAPLAGALGQNAKQTRWRSSCCLPARRVAVSFLQMPADSAPRNVCGLPCISLREVQGDTDAPRSPRHLQCCLRAVHSWHMERSWCHIRVSMLLRRWLREIGERLRRVSPRLVRGSGWYLRRVSCW